MQPLFEQKLYNVVNVPLLGSILKIVPQPPEEAQLAPPPVVVPYRSQSVAWTMLTTLPLYSVVTAHPFRRLLLGSCVGHAPLPFLASRRARLFGFPIC